MHHQVFDLARIIHLDGVTDSDFDGAVVAGFAPSIELLK